MSTHTQDVLRPMVWDSDYFTGAQGSVFIGDIWVDDITGIQFEVMHTKTPIYGYNSQYWDAMGRGVVMVRGSFTINFKEAGYMFLVLAEYHRKRQGHSAVADPRNYKFGGATTNSEIHPYVAKDGTNDERIMRQNIERVLSGQDPTDRYALWHSMAGYASEGQAIGGTHTGGFERMAEIFEDLVWGKAMKGGANTEALTQMPRRADDHRLGGFDLFVQLGDFAVPEANHTMRKIVDCHINGQSQVISVDDEPIAEAYSFIAKTIV